VTAIEYEVLGAKKLKKRLDLANLSALPLRKYFNSTGLIMTAKARELAPQDEGTLANSIRFRPVKRLGRLPRGIIVEATAPHAKFVHGDVNRKFRQSPPFNRTKPHFPPVEALRGWSERKGLNPYAVQQSIGKKGTPIVPFLRMAFNQSRPERKLLLKIVTIEIEQQFRKGRIRG
jgi:hypothetical protein